MHSRSPRSRVGLVWGQPSGNRITFLTLSRCAFRHQHRGRPVDPVDCVRRIRLDRIEVTGDTPATPDAIA